jgi:hypothetical protein
MIKVLTALNLRHWKDCILFAIAFALGGCSFTTAYNRAYVPNEQSKMLEPVRGKGLIYIEKADDLYVFTGKPTSFTGGGSTLTIPLGAITTGVAGVVFGPMFTDGFDTSNSLTNFSQYSVVIKPKATNFAYEYNALKNIGFAITPTVQISLEVKLLDKDGKPYWEKNYDSGAQEGDTYFGTLSPGEEISKIAHKTVYSLMIRAAADLRSAITTHN